MWDVALLYRVIEMCVGISFKGRNVSELRMYRENIFGKLVSLLNRNVYTYLLNLGTFDISTSQKSMTNYSGVTGGSSIRVRLSEVKLFSRDADHSYSYVKFNNNWNCASAPSYAIMTRVGLT